MNITVHSIVPDSVAEHLGIQPGDQLMAVNGRQDLEDMFDYQFEAIGSAYLELHLRRTDGSEEIYEIEKDPDEDPGLIFTSPIFTPIKTCNNACPFCFIDQQPEGLRPSVYVKDDDYRLSYFNNTYITLTNLTPHDVERIERIRPGPLYVSVHATTPAVRQELLMNKKAGDILEKLSWLKGLNVPFHCQIVICPGINDEEVLKQSLEDLNILRPEALSIAVVPVGLTQYRDDLPKLTPVETDSAKSVIDIVNDFRKTHEADGEEFVYLSDEFYFKAGLPLPGAEDYGDFPQLDDGVGTARMLLEDFHDLESTLPDKLETPQNIMILTGKLATMVLSPIATRLNEIEGLYVDLMGVESKFWGDAVNVAGLITGHDIIETLRHQDLSGYAFALIPSVMLKQGTQEFLDTKTVDEVSEQLGLDIRIVEDPYSAEELLEQLDVGQPQIG